MPAEVKLPDDVPRKMLPPAGHGEGETTVKPTSHRPSPLKSPVNSTGLMPSKPGTKLAAVLVVVSTSTDPCQPNVVAGRQLLAASHSVIDVRRLGAVVVPAW